MSHVTLYRKYRPQSFSLVAGQEEAVAVLKREVSTGKIGHAYLFSGPRGCGKTTVARLLAKAVNCLEPGDDGEPCGTCESCRNITAGSSLDVVEIDGASNRGIDEVRDLKEHVSLSPFSARFKVYIIDEVHMLTDAAFNALLKTLEEPPSSVVFIFATTEPAKVPATIRSRCQHIPFHRIDAALIVPCIRDVALKEGADFDERALWDIAREADGSLRDALSLLEQALSLGTGVSTEKLRSLFGGGSRKDLEQFVRLLRTDRKEAFMDLEGSFRRGLTGPRLLEGLFAIFRDLWIVKKWGDQMATNLPLAEEERRYVVAESAFWPEDILWEGMEFFASLMPRARWGLRSDVLGGLVFGFFEKVPAFEGTRKPGKAGTEKAEPKTPGEGRGSGSQGENGGPGGETKAGSDPGKQGRKKKETPTKESVPREEPAGTKVPEETAASGAVAAGEGKRVDPKLWNDFLESFLPDDIGLHCALLSGTPDVTDATLRVVFGEDDRLCFEMAKTGRNLAKIAGKRELLGKYEKMLLCCGEDEIDVESRSFFDLTVPEEAPAEEAGVKEDTGQKRSAGKTAGETAGKPLGKTREGETGRGNRKAPELDTVMSLFDAELLFVKEELSETDESGGDTVE
ncbi:MAG: DNA polymerase III subunit gamma/tau [Thermovirgaceae bacterium]